MSKHEYQLRFGTELIKVWIESDDLHKLRPGLMITELKWSSASPSGQYQAEMVMVDHQIADEEAKRELQEIADSINGSDDS